MRLNLNSKYTFILVGFFIGKNIDSCKRETPIYALVETEKTSPLEMELNSLPIGYDLAIKINLKRKGEQIPVLNTDQSLICAAELHANHMAKAHKCSHQIENEPKINKRVKSCGWATGKIVEILGCDFHTVEAVMESWSNTSTVNRTLMDPQWQKIGCYRADNYWVCLLG